MMFGNNPEHNEDWSTEDDEDGDPEDDDYDSENGEDGETMWEPMVKHYFHMNLKEEARRAREFRLPVSPSHEDDEDGGEEDRDVDDEVDAKRKLRNAKKRAEKRRKQKERKVREASLRAEAEERSKLEEERSKQEQEEALRRRKEELRWVGDGMGWEGGRIFTGTAVSVVKGRQYVYPKGRGGRSLVWDGRDGPLSF